MSNVKLYCVDDWEALYVNGSVVEQGHQIHRLDMLRHSKTFNFTDEDIECIELEYNTPGQIYVYEYGCFPDELSELLKIINS